MLRQGGGLSPSLQAQAGTASASLDARNLLFGVPLGEVADSMAREGLLTRPDRRPLRQALIALAVVARDRGYPYGLRYSTDVTEKVPFYIRRRLRSMPLGRATLFRLTTPVAIKHDDLHRIQTDSGDAAALDSCRMLLRQYGTGGAEDLHPAVAHLHLDAANLLSQLHEQEEALDVLATVIDRFGDDPVAAVTEQVVGAINNRGELLATLGRADESVATFRLAVPLLEASDGVACMAAHPSVLAASKLADSGDRQSAQDICAKLAARFDDPQGLKDAASRLLAKEHLADWSSDAWRDLRSKLEPGAQPT